MVDVVMQHASQRLAAAHTGDQPSFLSLPQPHAVTPRVRAIPVSLRALAVDVEQVDLNDDVA
jgi:hypothetical protein